MQPPMLNQNNIYSSLGRQHRMAYKMVRTESKIVHAFLQSYGFNQAHMNSNDFNLMWHGGHVKPISLRGLHDYQRVNHFPRSYELTRKDRMYSNVVKMQQNYGFKHFDFVSKSYVLPNEYQEFMSYYQREQRKGSMTWIIKPVASSRGRGIYLANNINHIPLDENLIVGRYIDNPLLIDGFKFDIRLYVAVTSYDPLVIYLYEEGLTRFCTIKYDKKNPSASKNLRMHLTNYSLNKKSMDYVRCENPDVEDYGNKWSMSAMLRYLRESNIDTAELCSKIEDVIIKAIIAVELPVATATKMFVPNAHNNCAELYGFDILVDENLKPWLLEVNLSPSLACDAPLDLKIKSGCIQDWLNLIGLQVIDPISRNKQYKDESLSDRTRHGSARSSRPSTTKSSSSDRDLSTEESKILKTVKEQYVRKGSFLRIFPRPDSWEKYGRFLQHRTTYNNLLARRLFRTSNAPQGVDSKSNNVPIVSRFARHKAMSERLIQYERKLSTMTEMYTKSSSKLLNKRSTQRRPFTAKAITNSDSKIVRKTSSEQKITIVENTEEIKNDRDENKSASKFAVYDQGKKMPQITSGPVEQVFEDPVIRNDSPIKLENKKQQLSDNLSNLRAKTKILEIQKLEDSSTTTKIISQPQKYDIQKPVVKRSVSQLRMRELSPAPIRSKTSTERKNFPSASTSVNNDRESISDSTITANARTKAKQFYQTLKLTTDSNFLTAIQARQAFHAYLTRFHIRLLTEAGRSPNTLPTSEQKQEQQLALVTRFLCRAAVNLPTPLHVTIPSKDQFNLVTRKKLIASQLSIFVQQYQKETDRQRLIDKHEGIGIVFQSYLNNPLNICKF